MAAEDYIDEWDVEGMMYEHPDGADALYLSRRQEDFPCENCLYSDRINGYSYCIRIRGVDKCPHAAWFAAHAQKRKDWRAK